jgi:hypothetical protein
MSSIAHNGQHLIENYYSFKFTDESLKCFKLNIIAVFCTLLLILSMFLNGSLLLAFLRYKTLRTRGNIFIIALTCINLFGSVLELPWIILSNFYCKLVLEIFWPYWFRFRLTELIFSNRWIFDYFGCALSAFLMYLIGCTSILLMCAISFERFYMIYDPLNLKKITAKKCYISIAICFLVSIFWSSMPLLGWSHYSLEGAHTSCSVEWNERSWNVTSYNIAIFIFVFLVPLVFIFATNLKLLIMVLLSRTFLLENLEVILY